MIDVNTLAFFKPLLSLSSPLTPILTTGEGGTTLTVWAKNWWRKEQFAAACD